MKLSEIYDLLKRSKESLEGIKSFCGCGLQIKNWHLNGELETFDSLINNNINIELNELDSALVSLERMIKIQNIIKEDNG